jgi:hypothetical protein
LTAAPLAFSSRSSPAAIPFALCWPATAFRRPTPTIAATTAAPPASTAPAGRRACIGFNRLGLHLHVAQSERYDVFEDVIDVVGGPPKGIGRDDPHIHAADGRTRARSFLS